MAPSFGGSFGPGKKYGSHRDDVTQGVDRLPSAWALLLSSLTLHPHSAVPYCPLFWSVIVGRIRMWPCILKNRTLSQTRSRRPDEGTTDSCLHGHARNLAIESQNAHLPQSKGWTHKIIEAARLEPCQRLGHRSRGDG